MERVFELGDVLHFLEGSTLVLIEKGTMTKSWKCMVIECPANQSNAASGVTYSKGQTVFATESLLNYGVLLNG